MLNRGVIMSDDSKTRARIRALLALAQDEGASVSEREVAMKRACVLMARHSITSLDVEAAERERIEVRGLHRRARLGPRGAHNQPHRDRHPPDRLPLKGD